MQVIYQVIGSYFEDDCADELTNEPVMTAILEKDALASQPTLSRFFNRMDEDTLSQLNQITRELRKIIYSINKPEFMLFDIDSTLLDTYGNQEGEGFNYHYQAHGYHPLLCYDGLTGDLLKAELRDGTMYCSKEADIFMKSLLDEFLCDFPDLPLYFRGDSGFASPDLYEVLEDKNCKYAIRLKENAKLRELAEEENRALYRATRFNQDLLSSSSKLVNANRLLIHALAYNLFNWFRRLALAFNMRKQRIDTIRLKLLKIAARVVKSARYKYFKLCSSCPYKKEFYETLENIRNLRPQLE